MNHKTRNDFFSGVFAEKILGLSKTKGVEYANSDEDANMNFKRIGEQVGIDPRQVLWIYASKHYDAISSYLRTGEIHSEPIDGRIHDLILYLFILLSLEYEHRIDTAVETDNTKTDVENNEREAAHSQGLSRHAECGEGGCRIQVSSSSKTRSDDETHDDI